MKLDNLKGLVKTRTFWAAVSALVGVLIGATDAATLNVFTGIACAVAGCT